MPLVKIIFFGTSSFAAHILEKLVRTFPVVAVVTKPDQPQGRHLHLMPSPVKVAADTLHIPTFQPVKCSTEEFAECLHGLGADLFIVVAYGEILSQRILDIPPFGCINVHASLLPKYRGAAPIHRSLINGEKESGISIIKMVKKMDAGDILGMKKVTIGPEMTFSELEKALCVVGSNCLLEVVHEIKDHKTDPVPQNEGDVTFAQKITPEECHILWDRPVEEVHNLIRGVSPHPGAWCMVRIRDKTKRLKILRATVTEVQAHFTAGHVVQCDKNGLIVACAHGHLKILEVQPEGKSIMLVQEFVKGIPNGEISFVNSV